MSHSLVAAFGFGLLACQQQCCDSGGGEEASSVAVEPDLPVETGEEPDESPCEMLAQLPPIEELCPKNRRVGHCSDQAPQGWEWSPLSKEGDGFLQTWCLFTNIEGGDNVPEATLPDCKVQLSGEGIPAEQVIASIEQNLRLTDVASDPQSGAPVMIAVIDTVEGDVTGARGHGVTMGFIARTTADGCYPAGGDSSCVRHVEGFKAIDEMGGYASDVAVAINRAVNTWLEEYKTHKLIISLSLGWEVLVKGEVSSPMVFEALQRASCHGALIVAASGNKSPYECSKGPLEPAIWERKGRPSAADCERFDVAPPAIDSIYSPLVHSISAVNYDDGDLANHRPGSSSRLAALGYHVSATGHGGVVHGPLSGTSVSTAIVAGVAARVWSREPELSGDAVLQLLWQSGRTRKDPLVEVYYPVASAPEQRVLSPCLALREVLCPPGAVACSLECQEPVTARGWVPQVSKAKIVHASGQETIKCPGCGAEPSKLHLDSKQTGTMVDPWANPQPDKPPCPPCWIGDVFAPGQTPTTAPTSTANLQLSDEITDTVTGVVITLWDERGAREDHIYATSLGSTDMVSITDPNLYSVGGNPPQRAWVEIMFVDTATGRTYSAGNEVPLIPDN